jgi:hypothetical protein
MKVRVTLRVDAGTVSRVPPPAAAQREGDDVAVEASTPLAALAILDPWLAAVGAMGRR